MVAPVSGEADRAAWARYVAGRDEASVFHDPRWSAAVERAFRHTPRHLVARRGDQVVGVLPLVEVQSLMGGRMLISVPYGTLGGAVADDEQVRGALVDRAIEMTRARDASVLELRSERGGVPGLEPVEGYVGFRKPLPERIDEVAASLPQHARAAARNAEKKHGARVRHDPALLPVAWSLYARSMRRLASINYPRRFFEELRLLFGAELWVAVVFVSERPVYSVIALAHGATVMPYVAGADDRIRCDGAANLLYRGVMEHAVELGYRRWDFGRSRADNAGAVSFKRNQGFQPEPLAYQRYVPAGRRARDLRPTSPRFALVRRVWSRLPLAVTRPLGAWLAHSLPG